MSTRCDEKVRGSAGFTLVEVLVALAILGLISVLASEALSFTVRSWRDGDSRSLSLQRTIASYDLVRGQLLVALPYYGSPNDPDRVSSFRGDSAGFHVATRAPQAIGLRGIVWFNVTSGQSARGKAMAVSWSDSEAGTSQVSGSAGAEPVPILERLDRLQFSYFGQATANGRPQWTSAWTRRDRPPDLVRITATFLDPAEGYWPDLVVHIRTDMSSRCQFDQVSRICRLS